MMKMSMSKLEKTLGLMPKRPSRCFSGSFYTVFTCRDLREHLEENMEVHNGKEEM